jgi:hypothetical protein
MAGEPDDLSEPRRREVFAALVAAQDEGLGIRPSREAVAARFGVAYEAVCEVEEEGLDKGWPPLGQA